MHIYRPEQNSGTLPILYFHAMARLGIEGLVITEPTEPFISLGMFDNLHGAIDLQACMKHNIPIMRREIGGGTVLLAPGQVFYNVVVRRDRRRVPQRVAEACEQLSQIPIQAYAALGVETSYRPVTDLITHKQQKISGQGSADIEDCFCFVGSILNHFDTQLMSELFPTGDERERSLILQSLQANMSWLSREMPTPVTHEQIATALIAAANRQFGAMSEQPLPDEVLTLAKELQEEFSSEETLLLESNRSHDTLKIREGVYLHRKNLLLANERYRLVIQENQGLIEQLLLSGEGEQLNEATLQKALLGQPYDEDTILNQLGLPSLPLV